MSKEKQPNTKDIKKDNRGTMKEGNIKQVNASNPMKHDQKGPANLSQQGMQNKGMREQYGQQKTDKMGSTSSITFGQPKFDQNAELLSFDAKKGGDQIRCSITQDALCECFDATPDRNALETCFTQHKREISKVLEKKWQAGKGKEIRLEARDFSERL